MRTTPYCLSPNLGRSGLIPIPGNSRKWVRTLNLEERAVTSRTDANLRSTASICILLPSHDDLQQLRCIDSFQWRVLRRFDCESQRVAANRGPDDGDSLLWQMREFGRESAASEKCAWLRQSLFGATLHGRMGHSSLLRNRLLFQSGRRSPCRKRAATLGEKLPDRSVPGNWDALLTTRCKGRAPLI